jgi:hypothetical protein
MTIYRLPRLPVVTVLCLAFYSSYLSPESLSAQVRPTSSALQIVNQMVQAESAANSQRQHFLYRRVGRSARTKGHLWDELVVETPDGRMHRLISEDGKPLSNDQKKAEDARIANLVNHPDEFRPDDEFAARTSPGLSVHTRGLRRWLYAHCLPTEPIVSRADLSGSSRTRHVRGITHS